MPVGSDDSDPEASGPEDLPGELGLRLFTWAHERFGVEHARVSSVRGLGWDAADFGVCFAVYDAVVAGKRTVDWYLQEHGAGLSAEERGWLLAGRAGWGSILRIVGVDSSGTATLEDLLTGAMRVVEGSAWLADVAPSRAIVARFVEHGGVRRVIGLYPAVLTPEQATRIARDLLGGATALDPEEMRNEHFMYRFLDHLENRFELTPEEIAVGRGQRAMYACETFGCDADGEEAEDDCARRIVAALTALGDVEPLEVSWGSQCYLVSDRGSVGSGRTAPLAVAFLGGPPFWIGSVAPLLAEAVRRVVADRVPDAPHLRHQVFDAFAPDTGESLETQRRCWAATITRRRYYDCWLDLANDDLGGKTPREAALTAEGRDELLAPLLRMHEKIEQMLHPEAPNDLGFLWATLGMARPAVH